MKYEVYAGATKVGTAETLGTATGTRRLINVFGTRATAGFPDREEDIEYDIDWPLVDSFPSAPWNLRVA